MKFWLFAFTVVAALVLFNDRQVTADQPLHELIDASVIAAAGDLPVAPRSNDAEFLRRIYLDLAGRIPTRDEARSFLCDPSADKREVLIDRLLAAPDYSLHMSTQFHIMLMERMGDDSEWQTFLRTSFDANTPWDEIAYSLLHANRSDKGTRGAAFFLTARLTKEGAMADVDVPGLTRDVGRLLAGKDFQCAQCHDHLSIDDYKQRDFQGLHAIFLNIKQDRRETFPAVTEGLMTERHDYMSVFVQQPEQTGPRVPGGGEIPLPTFAEGEGYRVPPDRKTREPGVPKFSPLAALAENLTGKENEVFRRNIVNRLWFLMMGRGLVHPLDEHHGGNPPSHPKLLDELGRQFAAHDFDIKWMLRQIALSDTYQRTSMMPEGQLPPPRNKFVLAHQKRISAEQLLSSTLIATGEHQFDRSVKNADVERIETLRSHFIKVFANPSREPEVEFRPSVEGTLFAMNNEQVQWLFRRRDGNLIDHLVSLPNKSVADALFISVLSRPPSEADRSDVLAFLKHSTDREKAVSQLAWALWASNEFFINH